MMTLRRRGVLRSGTGGAGKGISESAGHRSLHGGCFGTLLAQDSYSCQLWDAPALLPTKVGVSAGGSGRG